VTGSEPDVMALADAVRRGDRAATARLLTLVEAGDPGAGPAVATLAPTAGAAHVVGITGAPGAGKSSLTDHLVARLRAAGDEVSVLAVDPSSPASGGALLGDRVRMAQHTTDAGVFIRSMATRGQLGGLAAAVPQAIRVLAAGGAPWVLVETVGVGQVELDVAGAADTTVVVLTPGWGDAIQASKAGLLEVADVFAVNKADRSGADVAVRDLEGMQALSPSAGWRAPVVRTVATTGDGVADLWDAVVAHRDHLVATGMLDARRRGHRYEEVRKLVRARVLALVTDATDDDALASVVDAELATGRFDPSSIADSIVDGVLRTRGR
jgi:LAO/AO transport system kinase